jgi:hypothetical protein
MNGTNESKVYYTVPRFFVSPVTSMRATWRRRLGMLVSCLKGAGAMGEVTNHDCKPKITHQKGVLHLREHLPLWIHCTHMFAAEAANKS